MIISTIISVICFIAVVIECFYVYKILKSCVTVKCVVESSEKVQERKDGFLIREYWNSHVTFSYNNNTRTATLETSTFCQKGQILGCYYYPNRNVIFRKRDLRKYLKSSSLAVISVGFLFMCLNLMFNLANIGAMVIRNITVIISVILIIVFATMGVRLIVYSAMALKKTAKSNTVEVNAKIIDIIRKSSKHKENEQFTYYPIYRYNYKNEMHEIQSKVGIENPPIKGSTVKLLISRKKGGPVEYRDIWKSMVLGVCFIGIALLILIILVFM